MNQRIRVLHILEATTGGTRRHLFDLTTHLDSSVFEVSAVCATLRDKTFFDDIAEMRAGGVRVTEVQMVRHISLVRDLIALVRLVRHIRKHRYDVVHTHSAKAGFIGRVAAHVAEVPAVVHTPHVFPFQMDVSAVRKAFYLRLERIAARFADRIVCVCSAEKQTALQARVAPESKLTVIINGVEQHAASAVPADIAALRAELGLPPDRPVVALIGRFCRQKGQGYFVLAAREIVRRFPATLFLLVGEGRQRRRTEALIAHHGLGPHFVVIGARPDVASLYVIMDIVVCSSLWEGLPYSLLEAMAAGKAVVATAVGGIPEAVRDKRSGLLAPPKDPHALAEAIMGLLGDRARRAQLGEDARSFVRDRFRLADMVSRTEELYKTLLETPGRDT